MIFLKSFDERLTVIIRSLPNAWQAVMLGLSFVGEPFMVLIIGLSGFITALIRNQTAIEHAFVFAGIAFGLNILLKLLLHRARPHGLIIRTLGIKSYSFPSGHAFGTVIFYGLFAYLDIHYLAHPWAYLIACLLIFLIFLIGVSRVYLGTHFPSDVLAGWLLGLISLVIIANLAF